MGSFTDYRFDEEERRLAQLFAEKLTNRAAYRVVTETWGEYPVLELIREAIDYQGPPDGGLEGLINDLTSLLRRAKLLQKAKEIDVVIRMIRYACTGDITKSKIR